jgi:hypothetical protein
VTRRKAGHGAAAPAHAGHAQKGTLDRLALAAKNLGEVADLTDVDIAEAQLSKKLAGAAARAAGLLACAALAAARLAARKRRQAARLGDEQHEVLSATWSARSVWAGWMARARVWRPPTHCFCRCGNWRSASGFFHWWTAFPTVFAGPAPGFDAVIGNAVGPHQAAGGGMVCERAPLPRSHAPPTARP